MRKSINAVDMATITSTSILSHCRWRSVMCILAVAVTAKRITCKSNRNIFVVRGKKIQAMSWAVLPKRRPILTRFLLRMDF